MKSEKLIWAVALTLIATVQIAGATTTTWYVNGVSGSDTNNCLSAETACKTIRHAISRAASGDTIRVAAATYKESLTISKSLKVIGSGARTTIVDGGGGTVFTITNSSAVVTLSNMTVANGEGISNRGRLTISNSAVSGNAVFCNVRECSALGGGIYNIGTLTISNSTISGNMVNCNSYFCSALGGGIYNTGALTISNSTVSGNMAGAGITGCLLICPVTALGGGIYNTGELTISNSTLNGNGAQQQPLFHFGGGIVNSSGSTVIQNSILANNLGGNCDRGGITSKGYNLSDDGTCSFSNTGDLNNTHPRLGALGYYGGPTQTIPLLSGSPAIDAGNPSGCTDGHGHLLKTDQRGKPRPDPEDRGGCDMGAYESQSD
jgi:hypothetical protein